MGQTAALGAFNWEPTVIAGYVACIFLGLLALSIIILVWWAPAHAKRIDLTHLLNEVNGQASMSRFQLLLFTFVIAISVFELVMKNGSLPDVPQGVLTLLGISATTYAVGKGISYSQPDSLKPNPTPDDVLRAEAAADKAQGHASDAQASAVTASRARNTTIAAAGVSQDSAEAAQGAARVAATATGVSMAAAEVATAGAAQAVKSAEDSGTK